MFLPAEAIEEFRRIWKEEYGEDLPSEKAVAVAERFLSAIRLMFILADRADQKETKRNEG